MNISNITKIKKIADTYGMTSQQEMLIEECAELIQAMQKMKRADPADAKACGNAMKHLIEELADVSIMLEQMKHYLTPALLEDYNKAVTYKLDRQIERINKDKEHYYEWRESVNASTPVTITPTKRI